MLNNTKYTEYKSLLEKETQRKPVTQSNGRKRKPPFRITNCLNILGIDTELDKKLSELESKLDKKNYKDFKCCIIRSSFFIEATNPNPNSKSDATNYHVRWSSILKNDVRYASFQECFSIAKKLFCKLASLNSEKIRLLIDFSTNSIFHYELPIDYKSKDANPLHTSSNIDLFITEDMQRNTLVRKLIRDPEINPNVKLFSKILENKIKVKAYKTDRAQTGKYKTNREERCESHHNNYQFAYRRDCNDIETVLILQICKFKGAPKSLLDSLYEHKLLKTDIANYKCPITGDRLSYNDLKREILNPQHGKSSFQVGHLDPLKLTGKHKPNNIAWLSEDGNRIQGSLSLKAVDLLLKRIYKNRPELTK